MRILFMTGDQARAAFDASSGEIYASLLAGAAEGAIARATQFLTAGNEEAGEGWRISGAVGARDGSVDGDGNAADVESHGIDAELGLEHRGAGGSWLAGARIGYEQGKLTVPARGSSAELEGWQAAAYARLGSGGRGFTLSGAVAYANQEGDVVRNIAFTGVTRTASARVGLSSVSGALEARYGMGAGGALVVGPIATLAFAEADLDGLTESGANSLNLASNGGSQDLARIGAGLFARLRTGRAQIFASAQYVGGDTSLAAVPLTLAGAPGSPFTILSPRAEAEGVQLRLTGGVDLGGGWSAGADLGGFAGSDRHSLSGQARVSLRF